MRLPDYILERYLAGALDPARTAEVERALHDPDVAQRIAELRESNKEILERTPPRVFATAVRARIAARPAPDRRPLLVGGLSLAFAAALVAFVGLPEPTTTYPLEETRPKGDDVSRLLLFRQQDGQAVALAEGDRAQAGDRLQLAYINHQDHYGLLFSVDGRGTVTLHAGSATRPAPLENGHAVALPSSYELDDAPDFERFFLISAPEPFDPRPVLDAVRALDAEALAWKSLDLPHPLRQTSFVVHKESP